MFEALIECGVARMEYREAGACRITDFKRLADLTGLDDATWTRCPDASCDVDYNLTESRIVRASAPTTT